MIQDYALSIWLVLFLIFINNGKIVLILLTILLSDTLLCACYRSYGLQGILIGYIPSIIIENLTTK
jgi:hypothetical protein